MGRWRHIVLIVVLSVLGKGALAQEYLNDKYMDLDVFGWTIKINLSLTAGDSSLLKKVLPKIGKELATLSSELPTETVLKLRTVPIWLEEHSSHDEFVGCYHPGWPKKDINPLKVRSIELIASSYYAAHSSGNAWVLTHELAHAYQFRMLTKEDFEDMRKVYRIIYEHGLYNYGSSLTSLFEKGYVGANYVEYFAEISTAYFGHDYYYPKDRTDLRNYDPLGYALVERLWKVKDGKPIEPK